MNNTTPRANQPHIGIWGKGNAGKSSLFNALTGQEAALVSEVKGTTTDPVLKSMELIPVGPVVLIDTAGLDDEGKLGDLRVKRSLGILERTDLALYVMDASDPDEESYLSAKQEFAQYKIPYLLIINKIDLVSVAEIARIKKRFPEGIMLSTHTQTGITELKNLLIKHLTEDSKEPPLIGDLLPPFSTVILVVPIDTEAPKGRIVLPQVQVLRDCLDHGIKCYVVRDSELDSALSDLKQVDLVVTDSQVFAKVNRILPAHIRLTSFSLLFARHKGDLNEFVNGVQRIPELVDGSKVLITESCTHNTSHEDIGRVKIPSLLRKYTGKELEFQFCSGHDFPEHPEKYDLIIHCGACMLNRRTIQTRIQRCRRQATAITNYGVVLAYLTGILGRSLEVFKLNSDQPLP